MSDENSFGSMLKWARMKAQWTQKQVADKLKISRVTVNRWENDLQLPSAYYLKNLVTFFDLNEKEADALYRAAGQVPPVIDNLPFQRNPFFTGRKKQLERLREQLQETGTASITQSITISGLGGIGKTELALEYAHRYYPKMYRAALWVNADKATLEASYAKLAEILIPERNEQELERHIQAVKSWLQTHTNWLLIMDNADDLSLAESFLPAKPLGHVIFTTRSQIIDNIAANQIDIDRMELEDGLDLLLRRSRKLQVDAGIHSAALEVAELLGGHPLALDQAGAYIQGTGISFTDYVVRYHIERSRLLNKRRSLKSKDSEHIRHPLSVAATLELSIKEAGVEHPLATDILGFCAFLQPDAIPEELFQHDDSFKYDTTAFDEAIAALQRYSLIKRDIQTTCLIVGIATDRNFQQASLISHNVQEKTLSLHRLVQAVLIDDMPPDLQMQWRKRVIRAVNVAIPELQFDVISFSNPLNTSPIFRKYNRLVPNVLVCASWPEPDLVPVLEASELLHEAGSWLLRERRYVEAEPILIQTVALQERCLGAEHLDLAKTLHELAFTYHHRSDFDKLAEPLYRRAYAIYEKQLGFDHPLTRISLNSLAMVQMDRDGVKSPGHLIELTVIQGMPHLGGKQIYTREIREGLADNEQAREEITFKLGHDKGLDAEVEKLEVNDEPSE